MTAHQEYLGQIPAMNSLIIFSPTKITAKKPGTRLTAKTYGCMMKYFSGIRIQYIIFDIGTYIVVQSKQPHMTSNMSYNIVPAL